MSVSSNKRLIADFKGGKDDAVATAARKYFPAARKFLRLKGVRDALTPAVFATCFVKILSEIRSNKISDLADFNSLLNNALVREADAARNSSRAEAQPVMEEMNADVASQCVTVLDEQSQKLLYLRYAERKPFEEIAAIFNYSNPVIAQFEVEKAYRQLEGIVKVRFNMSQN